MGPGHKLYEEALALAGECLYRDGKHKGAAERYRKLLGRAPDHERSQTARLHLGECEVILSRAASGAAVLEEFLQRHGDNSNGNGNGELARANLWLGRARQARREHGRAQVAFKRATVLSQGDIAAEAQFRIGECRVARNILSDAVDAFLKLSILYNHATWVQRGLNAAGDCYVQLKQPTKARKLFEELVERFPKSALAKGAQSKLQKMNC